MDPLSVLAVAAAAFQFLDLGGKLCAKGWEKYKQIQRDVSEDQKHAEEVEELEKTFKELAHQISWFRQISTSIVVSQPPTPTQIRLLGLSSECTDLSSDFERIEGQMKPPSNQKMNSEIHLRQHVATSRRHIQEKDCRECQRRKKEENAEAQRNKEDIERITGKLGPLKRDIMDFIILSLWDDAQRTQRWELHFSSQLDKLIGLFESEGKIPMNNPQTSVLSNQMTTTVADEELIRLRNALQSLIQPGKEPVSLKQLSESIIKYLKVDSGAIDTIRGELVNILWKNDWKLDTSMASAKIDTTTVAHAIAAGIRFNNFQTREDAISKTFEETYSWIFQNEPPKKKNMPMWDSFPKWLEGDSNKVYWITGKPGSGKSTLMKLISQHVALGDVLSRSLGSLRLLRVKYYAWLAGTTLQKTLEGLKRTILSQALEQYPDLAPILMPRRWAFCQILRNTSGLPEWNEWEIEDSFEALLSSCGETIKLALFIDGLDEFDTPPFEVIKFIQNMMTRCPNGFKICAASRPWPEFLDEFNEGPMLQMHLLTENDMKIFVNEHFKTNKGFVEQRELNPEAVSQLLMDIVQRANGVFLWVSIVVQHLFDCFTEGQSVSQARQILEALPTNISSLYDAIWAGIRPNNLPDASYMIQVLRAFEGPLQWSTLWLIEESRFTTTDRVVFPETGKKMMAAQRSLKRKLATRTKCILEINEDGKSFFVDFIHRTARDWAVQPNVWQSICSKSSGQFDPYFYILKGETLELLRDPARMTIAMDLIDRLLRHASQVKDIPENESEFVNCLNLVSERLESFFKFSNARNQAQHRNFTRVITSKLVMYLYENNFLNVAAHFAILPYIKAVARSHPSRLSQEFSRGSLRLLRKTIYGDSTDMDTSISEAYRDRRLATVKYLLQQNVYQWRAHIWSNEFRNLKEDTQKYLINHPENSEYYSTVVLYLDEKESELSVRSRIRSFFMKRTQ